MDYFDDNTDFSAWGSDYTPDASWFGTDVLSQFNPAMDPGGLGDWGGYSQTANTPMAPYYSPGSAGNPTGNWQPYPTTPIMPQQQAGGWGSLLTPQNVLGLGGGIAGLVGTLMGGGVQGQTQPQIPTNAMAQLNAGASQLNPFVAGASPLQTQQGNLLAAIAGGQGLAQPYAQAIEQAFQPQLGRLYDQAVQAGRMRGFYDSPATSPPGGAILGPGLADIQGQMAAAKIAQMNALPGLFQNPINTQVNAASNQSGSLLNAANLQRGSQQSVPLAPQIGQAIGGGLQSIGQGMQQQQAQQQNQQYQNSLLSALRYPGYGV